MVSLLLSKIGDPEGFAPIPSSSELPCEGKLHRSYSHGVGFQIFFMLVLFFGNVLEWNVLRNEGFYGSRSANLATNLLIRSNPTAGGRPQTQLGTRYGWPLAHKELLHPLDRPRSNFFSPNPEGWELRTKHISACFSQIKL